MRQHATITETDVRRPTRRSLFVRATGASAAVFAWMAARGAAEAGAYPYHCCGLATNTHCSGCPSGSFSCPSGYHRKYWFCCQNGGLYGCGECTKSTTSCFSGPFKCSCGYVASGPCRP
jgi:hypothetical protein